jgi:ABC-type molybdenum transport system ATPase subunit/photorepair protein PhrA
LSLAASAVELEAPHPGVVVLDEPLQQNPDPEHREKLLDFLRSLSAGNGLAFQTIVLTRFLEDELSSLAEAGVSVEVRREKHLLRLVRSESANP